MEQEKKYSIVGKVEIGTDEYRDLIEGIKDLENRVNDGSARYWSEYNRANTAETKCKALQEQVDEFKEFITSSEELTTKFKQFKLEKLQ